MKRNFIMIVAAVVAVLAFWSCKKEVESSGTGESSKISISVTGEIEDFAESDAKASIGIVTRLSWVDGDKVFVYSGTEKLGTLTVSLKKSDNRYAYLGGTITAPTDGSTKLTCVYAKGIETAPEIDENGEVRFSMASQTADDTPFVVYGTMDYSPGQTEISDELVNFEFATAVVLVNCVGLANGVAVTNAELSGINTNCVLSLSGTAAPEVSGEDVGTIATSGTFQSGNGKLYYQIGVPVSAAVNPATNPESQRKLTVTQQTKTRSTNFTSSAFEAGGFANVAYRLEGSQYTVTLFASPEEGGVVHIDSEPVSSKDVAPGTQVSLQAIPNQGYKFSKWSDGWSDATRVETINEDATYTAEFTKLIVVNVASSDLSKGSVSGAGSYSPDADVTITATPESGYAFEKWVVSPSGVEITDNPYEFTATADISFTAYFKESTQPQADGSLPGVFSVSATKKVKFSQGNLQYQASTNTWRFAEHQYDFVGDGGSTCGNVGDNNNLSIGENYSGWIDLFGWGTSGSSKNRKSSECYAPWSIKTTTSYYYINGEKKGELNVSAETDWGFNTIKVFDGKSYIEGRPSNGWRTPTKSDWEYIMGLSSDGRGGLRYMQCFVTINNKNIYGILVFPDDWTVNKWPSKPQPNVDKYNIATSSAEQTLIIQSLDYQALITQGVVFLPQTRIRYGNQRLEEDGTSVYKYDSMGYWSATAEGGNTTVSIYVSHKALFKITLGTYYYRDRGMAVRLVTDVTSTK